jgi:Protein of unknown function (DUF3800)
MYIFYLDDSGTGDDSSVITMAGFVATEAVWAQFETEAEALFERYGVDVLHTQKLHHHKAPFRWDYQKRVAFVQELSAIANWHVDLGMALSIKKEAYVRRSAETGLNNGISAYAYCLAILLNRLMAHEELVDKIIAEGVAFKIERGNKNEVDVRNRYEALRGFRRLSEVLKDIILVPKNDSRAIQLADFLAFHSRRHADACEDAGGVVDRDPFYEILARACQGKMDAVVATNFGGPDDAPEPFRGG